MIKGLLAILFIGVVSIYKTDLESDSAFVSILLPIVSVFSLIALALWLVSFFHKRGISQTTKPGGSGIDFSSDGSGGGDGG